MPGGKGSTAPSRQRHGTRLLVILRTIRPGTTTNSPCQRRGDRKYKHPTHSCLFLHSASAPILPSRQRYSHPLYFPFPSSPRLFSNAFLLQLSCRPLFTNPGHQTGHSVINANQQLPDNRHPSPQNSDTPPFQPMTHILLRLVKNFVIPAKAVLQPPCFWLKLQFTRKVPSCAQNGVIPEAVSGDPGIHSLDSPLSRE